MKTGAMKTFQTHSAEETTELGRRIAAELKPGSIVLLRGDLGQGRPPWSKALLKVSRRPKPMT